MMKIQSFYQSSKSIVKMKKSARLTLILSLAKIINKDSLEISVFLDFMQINFSALNKL